MGAYEYGSVYMGGIQGYVYAALTLQPLDCAQIKIAGKPCSSGIYLVRLSLDGKAVSSRKVTLMK